MTVYLAYVTVFCLVFIFGHWVGFRTGRGTKHEQSFIVHYADSAVLLLLTLSGMAWTVLGLRWLWRVLILLLAVTVVACVYPRISETPDDYAGCYVRLEKGKLPSGHDYEVWRNDCHHLCERRVWTNEAERVNEVPCPTTVSK